MNIERLQELAQPRGKRARRKAWFRKHFRWFIRIKQNMQLVYFSYKMKKLNKKY